MGLLNSFKRGVGRATFAVDRKLRLSREETAISSLRKGLETYYMQLGEAAYQVYKRKRLGDPALEGLCEQIAVMERDLAEREAEAARIRAEGTPLPSAPLFGHVCLTCRMRLSEEAVFCPKCGGAVTDVLAPSAVAVTRTCPSCSAGVTPEALFCAQCGQRLDSEMPARSMGGGATVGGSEGVEPEPLSGPARATEPGS